MSSEENMTSCPALTHTPPSVPPTMPEPTMPIFIFCPEVAARASRGRPPRQRAAATVFSNPRRFGFIRSSLTPQHQRERDEYQGRAAEHGGGDGFAEDQPAPHDAEDGDGEADGQGARRAD